MTENLVQKICTPCQGGIPPLGREDAERYLAQVPGWKLVNDARAIEREYRFGDFREALAFVNDVGGLAESEGHHPDICFGWGHAKISIHTHKIKGLHENDFILAAKIDQLPSAKRR